MSKILIVSGNLMGWQKNNGGAERTITLAEAFPNDDVTFLCFDWTTIPTEGMVDKNIKYVRVALEQEVIDKFEYYIQHEAINDNQIATYFLKPMIKEFSKKILDLAKESDILIMDHFNISPLVEDLAGMLPIVYNAHNCEISMCEQLYPDDKYAQKIVGLMEKSAIESSIAMTYCSTGDITRLNSDYSIPGKTKYIPNGTILHHQTDPKIRFKSKDIMFVGSGHPPNGVAAKRILKIANLLPQYNFIIAGDAGFWLNGAVIPKNVKVLGPIDDFTLDKLFKESFAFINPMNQGSGTHLKMMRALSYGIPIITSPVGARGFSEEEKSSTMIMINSTSDSTEAIDKLSDLEFYKTISNSGHLLSRRYGWENIKFEYRNFIKSIIGNTDDNSNGL